MTFLTLPKNVAQNSHHERPHTSNNANITKESKESVNSSQSRHRWQHLSNGVTSKIKYFEVFNKHDKKSPNSKKSPKSKVKSARNIPTPKPPNSARESTGDIRLFFTREYFSAEKSGPAKSLKS